MTITEALAEIKTALAKIGKKEGFLRQYAWRPDVLVDPFIADGGVKDKVKKEIQATMDLWKRIEQLRIAIQKRNLQAEVSVRGQKNTVAAWLVWRRDIAPKQVQFWAQLSSTIAAAKSEFIKAPKQASDGRNVTPEIHVDESMLAKAQEDLAATLGELDGQLSLFNATTDLGEV